MTRAIEHEAKLASQIVFFEDLFIWHIEHNFKFHEQCVDKLLITAEENLATMRTFLQYLEILALRHSNG